MDLHVMNKAQLILKNKFNNSLSMKRQEKNHKKATKKLNTVCKKRKNSQITHSQKNMRN